MRVLVACEFSGVVRDAFRARGHEATSIDLLPSETSGHHVMGDVRLFLDWGWDLMLAFPPCTDLATSGARHFERKIRGGRQQRALNFVQTLLDAPIPRIALENPLGVISTKIRKPDQIIQPWQFGEDASKRTCLWLKGLPRLVPTDVVVRDRYANQGPSGQNKLGPGPNRAHNRSRTFEGIAAAMAQQWG